jgi:hypothetical protein
MAHINPMKGQNNYTPGMGPERWESGYPSDCHLGRASKGQGVGGLLQKDAGAKWPNSEYGMLAPFLLTIIMAVVIHVRVYLEDLDSADKEAAIQRETSRRTGRQLPPKQAFFIKSRQAREKNAAPDRPLPPCSRGSVQR